MENETENHMKIELETRVTQGYSRISPMSKESPAPPSPTLNIPDPEPQTLYFNISGRLYIRGWGLTVDESAGFCQELVNYQP